MNTILNTQRLRKSFNERAVVKDIDLSICEGEIFGFLGPNGAGKTTTLRMLATLLDIESGEAYIDGKSVRREPQAVREVIGYVGQKGGADLPATGRENLHLQGRLYGLSGIEVKQRTDELIEIFSLEECIDRYVKTYSGGQQRRLEIAMGMISRPKLLFLDEPTTGLDPQNRTNLRQQIQSLNKLGVTIFITSHYLEEVDFLAHRVAIMDHGEIVALDTPKRLKEQISGEIVEVGMASHENEPIISAFEGLTFVREVTKGEKELRLFVDDGAKALPHILRLLDDKKITLDTLKLSLPTLNDVFLKKTGRTLRK